MNKCTGKDEKKCLYIKQLSFDTVSFLLSYECLLDIDYYLGLNYNDNIRL